jgi:transposase-like protein
VVETEVVETEQMGNSNDKLGSYGSAFRQLRLACPHDRGLRKNNRAENSHQIVRRRERKMQQVVSIRASRTVIQHPA